MEVASQLKEVLRSRAEPPDPASLAWEAVGPTELRVRAPDGGVDSDPVAAVRTATETGGSHPAIGAIVSVEPVLAPEPVGRATSIRILSPRKPPAFEPEPGHLVACLLYDPEKRPEIAVEPYGR